MSTSKSKQRTEYRKTKKLSVGHLDMTDKEFYAELEEGDPFPSSDKVLRSITGS